MILRRFLATVGSVGLVAAVATAQSNPQTAPTDRNSADVNQTQSARSPHDIAKVEEMTLAGCLMPHRDVPGPTNVPSVNRAVKHDGFLLVDAMTVSHHRGSNGMRAVNASAAASHDHSAAASPPVVNPTPNVGDSQMFKIEGLSDAELGQFAGRRVTLMGALIKGDTPTPTPGLATDDHGAAPFKATMIHLASGPCRQ